MDPISGNFVPAEDIATHWQHILKALEKVEKKVIMIHGELEEVFLSLKHHNKLMKS